MSAPSFIHPAAAREAKARYQSEAASTPCEVLILERYRALSAHDRALAIRHMDGLAALERQEASRVR